MNWINLLKEELKRDEGLRLKAYQCTSGIWTIGYGATKMLSGDPVKKGDVIDLQTALSLLDRDVKASIEDAMVVCKSFNDLNGERKAVLANLAFNIGINKLKNFKNTLACIHAKDYSGAALEMLNSKWASQVGQRAQRLAKRMSTGKW